MGKFKSIIAGISLLLAFQSAQADNNSCGSAMLSSLGSVQRIVGSVGDPNLTRFLNTGSEAAWANTQTASLMTLSGKSDQLTAALNRCMRPCGDSSQRLADLCQGLVGLSMSSMKPFISNHRGVLGYKAKIEQAMQ